MWWIVIEQTLAETKNNIWEKLQNMNLRASLREKKENDRSDSTIFAVHVTFVENSFWTPIAVQSYS